jgi:hypothetical protein
MHPEEACETDRELTGQNHLLALKPTTDNGVSGMVIRAVVLSNNTIDQRSIREPSAPGK